MPQLSIVIPCVHDAVLFEATLASVLQNRPDDCEVLVVQPRAYDDPYQLAGEVTFVEAPGASPLTDLVNLGFRLATGPVVHVLSCDVEVCDGWTEPVVPHFADPTVGCVSPLIVTKDAGAVVARGVHYSAGGRRAVCTPARSRRRTCAARLVGPALTAGFYRRAAVLEVGGFCREVGDALADVDLALALQSVGLRTLHEQNSIVTTTSRSAVPELSFRRGLEAERLFWRNGSTSGWWRALVCHPWVVLDELARNLHRPSVILQLLGRARAACEFAGNRGPARAQWATPPESHQDVIPFSRTGDTEGSFVSHPRAAA